MLEEQAQQIETHNPSAEEREKVSFIYRRYDWMDTEVMKKPYREFNNRTLKQFLDDSQKRANSYVATREEQDKEDWQANVFTGTTRNKVRAYNSAVAKTPPGIRIKAVNEDNVVSLERSDIMKNLVRHSYLYCNNPELDIFNDGWDCSIDGTIIKYDGYLLIKDKVKTIKDW